MLYPPAWEMRLRALPLSLAARLVDGRLPIGAAVKLGARFGLVQLSLLINMWPPAAGRLELNACHKTCKRLSARDRCGWILKDVSAVRRRVVDMSSTAIEGDQPTYYVCCEE
jgi:hypothetical protein